jgi:hypothetical protein
VGGQKYGKIGLCLTKGNKNWTSATVFLMNFKLAPRGLWRNFLFLLMVPVMYVLNMYKSTANETAIKKTGPAWPLWTNLPLSVTSLQLYGLIHIYGKHHYPLYILTLSMQKFPSSNLLLNHAESTV